jgi:uncharacterized RDD family membrane protein YckC
MDDIIPENPQQGLASQGNEYSEASSGKKVCSACRTINEASSMYCYRCGIKLPDEIKFDIEAGGVTAGFFSRFSAGFLDQLLIYFIVSIILMILMQMLPGDVLGFEIVGFSYVGSLKSLCWFLGVLAGVEVLYFTVATAASGRTIGKILLGLRVVREDGSRVSLLRSLARCLAYIIQLGLIFGLTFFVIAFNPEKRAIHDMISGTKVVIS